MKVLARVNGKEITETDLNRVIEKYPVEKKIYFETNQGKQQLLEQKVAFTLFGMYGKEEGIDKTEDFILKIEDIKEQILTQIMMQELFKNIEVTDEDVQEFYEENPDKFKLEETVEARHILVEKEEEAEKIRKELLAKELSFEEAAKKYSVCPSKDKGGNLGYFKRGMMVKEFEDCAFDMELNQLSPVVKSQFGYHLIEVLDKTEPGFIPLEEVADKLKEQLTAAEQQKVYEKKLEELKKKYSCIFE